MYLSSDLAILIPSFLLQYLQLKQKQMVVAPSQKPAFTTNHQVTKENRSEALEPQQPDEVVPVEVRPGHIRFETLGKLSLCRTFVHLLLAPHFLSSMLTFQMKQIKLLLKKLHLLRYDLSLYLYIFFFLSFV